MAVYRFGGFWSVGAFAKSPGKNELNCYGNLLNNKKGRMKIFEENLMLNDVINIGGALEFTIKEVAELIIKKTQSSSKIIYLPALKEGDMTRRMPDNTKMLNILQKDLTPLEKGIDLMLKHPDYNQ